jgi:hypothetical protein
MLHKIVIPEDTPTQLHPGDIIIYRECQWDYDPDKYTDQIGKKAAVKLWAAIVLFNRYLDKVKSDV